MYYNVMLLDTLAMIIIGLASYVASAYIICHNIISILHNIIKLIYIITLNHIGDIRYESS